MADAGFVGAASWWQRPQHEWRPGERLLACAAAAVADLREAVRRELGYTCSAGVAHTKLMAKLCSGCDGKRGGAFDCMVPSQEDCTFGRSRAPCDAEFRSSITAAQISCGAPQLVLLPSPASLDATASRAGCTSLPSRLYCQQMLFPSCWARCPFPSCGAWAANLASRQALAGRWLCCALCRTDRSTVRRCAFFRSGVLAAPHETALSV